MSDERQWKKDASTWKHLFSVEGKTDHSIPGAFCISKISTIAVIAWAIKRMTGKKLRNEAMIPSALPRIGWSSDFETYNTQACQTATRQRRNGIASPAIFPKTGTARNNSIEKDNHFIRESTAHTSCLQSMQREAGGACQGFPISFDD
jgi:hypothetical protein